MQNPPGKHPLSRARALVAVTVVALGAIAIVFLSLRGGNAAATPEPYDAVDVNHVYNASGLPSDIVGSVPDPHGGEGFEHPDGYRASVQGGGHWGAAVFEDTLSAAVFVRSVRRTLRLLEISSARCGNVVIVGREHEPEQVCAALADPSLKRFR